MRKLMRRFSIAFGRISFEPASDRVGPESATAGADSASRARRGDRRKDHETACLVNRSSAVFISFASV
jgi:hypothetical protein